MALSTAAVYAIPVIKQLKHVNKKRRKKAVKAKRSAVKKI